MQSTSKPKTWRPGAVLNCEGSSILRRDLNSDAWQRIIDNTLAEWERNPSEMQDAGIEPPSDETICHAIVFARQLRDQGLPAPTNVVPDPNGGIVFQHQELGGSEEYHFWDDGVVEYLCFEGPRLVERRRIA